MNFPQTDSSPDDPESMPPARRRRARRLLAPLDTDEKADFLDNLAHRASPSFDFFLFSLLAGIVMAAGLVLDSTPLLVLGTVLAPLMAPAVGVSLGAVTGSMRFFARSLAGLLIGGSFVLAGGAAAGYLTRSWPPLNLEQAHLHAQLSCCLLYTSPSPRD